MSTAVNPRVERFYAEIPRKAVHLGFGILPLAYALTDARTVFIAIYAAMSAGILCVEWIRRRKGTFLAEFFIKHCGLTLRPQEIEGNAIMGATPYCLTGLAVVVLFAQPAAVLALLYLAVGDTAASLVGIRFGRIRLGRKTLEGTAAFWAACSLVALAAHAVSPEYALAPALVAAFVAAVAELALQRLDDNLTVPAFSALAIWLAPLVIR